MRVYMVLMTAECNCTLQTEDSERMLVRTWRTSTARICLSRLTKFLVWNTHQHCH